MISTALNRENMIKCWFQGLFKSPGINTNPATEYVCVSVFINVDALKLKYQILLVDTSTVCSEQKSTDTNDGNKPPTYVRAQP